MSLSVPYILLTPARRYFPPSVAHTGEFTQGQVGHPAAPVVTRFDNNAKDGQPLPGDSPPDGGIKAPAWGHKQHPLATSKGVSLPAGRVF